MRTNTLYVVILGILVACQSHFLWAQNQLQQTITLTWKNEAVLVPLNNTQQINTIGFEGAAFLPQEHSFPVFVRQIPVAARGRIVASLQNVVYSPITENLSANLKGINEKIGADIMLTAEIGTEKRKNIASVQFIPIRKNPLTGMYEKMLSADLHLQITPEAQVRGNRQYAEQSVLSQGTHYKFKVDQDGIYKIDKDLLNGLGVSLGFPIANLRIYGNGGGMLPELAGAQKYDDLTENPIKTFDNNQNGLFDADDYAIFYAESPHHWQYNATQNLFECPRNTYTDYNYYYLNTDLGAGKRIAMATPPSAQATHQVTTFDEHLIHENDEINVNKSGRTWFGEIFTTNGSQIFTFDIPNLAGEARLTSFVGGRCLTFPTSFSIAANGANVQTHNIGVVMAGYEYPYGRQVSNTTSLPAATNNRYEIEVKYNQTDPAGEGWLRYLLLNARRQLVMPNGQMGFRDRLSVGSNNIANFAIQADNNIEVWDVSHIDLVQQINLTNNGNTKSFVANANELREYIAFDNTYYLKAEAVGKVDNQNLHQVTFPDYIVITHPNFLAAAERIAQHHATYNQLSTKVVTTEQVYNEFASGAADITALRDFIKMYYDRADGDENLMPQSVLLLGDASYDFKNRKYSAEDNHNFVPTYQSVETLNSSDTYCTDDYFAYLDDNEGNNLSSSAIRLDVAIGRLAARTETEALAMVDKVIHYVTADVCKADWRNTLCFIADDQDGNLHLGDAEDEANAIRNSNKNYNVNKIYLDAYPQVATSGGQRYPTVNEAIKKQIFEGALMMNYIGHGGEDGWALERVLDRADIPTWRNYDKLPLVVTATCSFTRYDNPNLTSAGEELMLNPQGGAVALMTTVRLVYASSNAALNGAFHDRLYTPINGTMPNIGEVARLAKNDAAPIAGSINNHKFVLLGDPAMRLVYPEMTNIYTTQINNTSIVGAATDTLRALQKVTISGELRRPDGSRMTDFSGTIYPTVYEKEASIPTLANDRNNPPGSKETNSLEITFKLRKNIIFKGQASVNNGAFTFSFIVPKDINYQYGLGKISYYATNTQTDATGYSEAAVIGGLSSSPVNDQTPPTINLFMGDESFVFGGITNEDPVLIAKIQDDNGINTAGNGVGHDITATIDNNADEMLALNNYYKTNLDDYTSGIVRYPLFDLAEGIHTIEVKAWDITNNSGKGYTEFIVASTAELALHNVLNYPNPFINSTDFWFETNRSNEPLLVTVQIYSLSGKLVKTIQQNVTPTGYRISEGLKWDGNDDFGNPIGRGVYIYVLNVKTTDQKTAKAVQRLVVLK
jgi:hypothetical protein